MQRQHAIDRRVQRQTIAPECREIADGVATYRRLARIEDVIDVVSEAHPHLYRLEAEIGFQEHRQIGQHRVFGEARAEVIERPFSARRPGVQRIGHDDRHAIASQVIAGEFAGIECGFARDRDRTLEHRHAAHRQRIEQFGQWRLDDGRRH